MLIRRDEHGLLAIGQLSHAWISGQLARAWGNERFPAPTPREEIALGAEQHDIGWALFDLKPRANPDTGLPLSFLELSVEEHLEIWRDAPERLLSQSHHAALVVSMHGCALSQLRAIHVTEQSEREALAQHIAVEQQRQARLRSALGLSAEDAKRTQRQMWTWDGLSLALCLEWRPFTARGVPAREGEIEIELRDRADGTFTLDPWPFADERVELRCEARRLNALEADEQALQRSFEQAVPLTLRFVLLAR
jgi:heme exporter protein D